MAVARTSGNKKIRILLVDDHPLVRLALTDTLRQEKDIVVCGEAEDRKGALAAVMASKPDLAIVDLTLKNSDGLELIKDIRDLHPSTLMLVLSMHDETLQAERVIRAGASGYLCKQEAPGKLIEAVRKILSGEIYWSERAAAHVASRIVRRKTNVRTRSDNPLSEREQQIFELIGTGATTAQISASLHIDVSTVETYRARMKEKLNLKDATELLQAAIRWNMANTPR